MSREQPELSAEEWRLILELLEQERRDLPTEIRRTQTASVRDELRSREKLPDGLLLRIRAAVA
jgi:hypothetical protein